MMRIIRRSGLKSPSVENTNQPSTRLLRKVILNAKEEAARIVKAAEEHASSLLKNAYQHSQLVFRSEQQQLVKLAVQIAEKLIAAELALKPEAIAKIVEQAISQTAPATRGIVRLNPLDFDLLQKHPQHLVTNEQQLFSLEPDHNLNRGSCIVQTERGEVDARLELQLKTIEQSLLANLN